MKPIDATLWQRWISLVLLSGLVACTAEVPPPSIDIQEISVPDHTLEPGERFAVRYRLQYDGAIDDIEEVRLSGYPQNAIDTGTKQILAKPKNSGESVEDHIELGLPAKAGHFELWLDVTLKDGRQAKKKAGVITIKDVPARPEFAQFEPGSHRVSRCGSRQIPVKVKYGLIDPNGTSDPQSIVLSEQPVAAQGKGEDLISQQDLNKLPELALPLSKADDQLRDLLSATVSIKCGLPAPGKWTWLLVVKDIDALTGEERSHPLTLDYYTQR